MKTLEQALLKYMKGLQSITTSIRADYEENTSRGSRLAKKDAAELGALVLSGVTVLTAEFAKECEVPKEQLEEALRERMQDLQAHIAAKQVLRKAGDDARPH